MKGGSLVHFEEGGKKSDTSRGSLCKEEKQREYSGGRAVERSSNRNSSTGENKVALQKNSVRRSRRPSPRKTAPIARIPCSRVLQQVGLKCIQQEKKDARSYNEVSNYGDQRKEVDEANDRTRSAEGEGGERAIKG